MHLKKLILKDFRNYTQASTEFCSATNSIWGSNAQGKTNLLEAVHFLTVGRSFRSNRTREVIREGAQHFYLEAHFMRDGTEQRLRIAGDGTTKKIIYNETVCPTAANLLGLLPSVLIEPDDELIKGPPKARRLFLDLLIAQVDPLYVHYLARFNRAMRQRNQLLRIQRTLGIESWEHEMGHAAGYVVAKRLETIERILPHCQHMHEEISHESAQLSIVYQSRIANLPREADKIAALYSAAFARRERDLQVGSTQNGPHRDDLGIFLGTQDMRIFGSEGQKRTLVTVLRLAGWHLLNELIGDQPLMLIDDLGLSLDKKRRDKLIEYVGSLGQSFITSTIRPEGISTPTHTLIEIVNGSAFTR